MKKNKYKVLIEVRVYERDDQAFRPVQWTWHCTDKNQLGAINQIIKCYKMSDYGYEKEPYKIELDHIISVTKGE